MVAIRVDRGEFKKLNRFLTTLERRQLPFAQAGAINDSMFTARRVVVDTTWPQSVTVRNRRFMGVAMRIAKASKRKLDAELFDRLNRAFLPWQASGGTRGPGQGSGIAIPTTFTKTKRSKTTGKMLKAWQPRNPKFDYRREQQLVVAPKQGVVYTVRPQVRIKKSFPFFEVIPNVLGREFPGDFQKRFDRAVNTAIQR